MGRRRRSRKAVGAKKVMRILRRAISKVAHRRRRK